MDDLRSVLTDVSGITKSLAKMPTNSPPVNIPKSSRQIFWFTSILIVWISMIYVNSFQGDLTDAKREIAVHDSVGLIQPVLVAHSVHLLSSSYNHRHANGMHVAAVLDFVVTACCDASHSEMLSSTCRACWDESSQ